MKRLFTFGCSFTNYRWATWADILAREYSHYENWGLWGCGNQFIFNSLLECYHKNKFTSDDTVIIMWTSVAREDRYRNNKWLSIGNIYTQYEYDQEFVKKYADERWYLLRDLATISATKQLLDSWGVKYEFLSMVPIDNKDQHYNEKIQNNSDVLAHYQSAVSSLKPSIYEVVFNCDWYSRFTEEEYIQFAKADWPSYNEFMQGVNTTKEVISFRKGYLLQDTEYTLKDYFTMPLFTTTWNDSRDTHARPLEHLEYLQKVLPDYPISEETISWVKQQQTESLTNLAKANKPFGVQIKRL